MNCTRWSATFFLTGFNGAIDVPEECRKCAKWYCPEIDGGQETRRFYLHDKCSVICHVRREEGKERWTRAYPDLNSHFATRPQVSNYPGTPYTGIRYERIIVSNKLRPDIRHYITLPSAGTSHTLCATESLTCGRIAAPANLLTDTDTIIT
jgi:hypothetical protein